MDKRHHMLDEWIKILKGKWNGDYTHLAIYDYGKAAHWRYDECPCLPEQCFSKGEFEARLAEIEKENDMNESTLVPREEMSDLDWLARNVHVWVPNELLRMKPCDNGNGTFRASWCYSGDGGFTKDQWLALRAELQNKPSWADAPEWAEFLGQDDDGVWFWHGDEPNSNGEDANGCLYWMSHGLSDIACRGGLLGDWRDTLEKRPEQAEFKPFVSVEDAKITIMQSDGDVKHFGGIIGRSLPLEEDAATAKQPTPKGIGKPILGMVLADLTNRALEGKEKYSEPLLAHNGRNPLWDAYQEALDLAMYLRQAIEEQKQ